MSPQLFELQSYNPGEFFFITKHFKNRKTGNRLDKSLSIGFPVVGENKDMYTFQLKSKTPDARLASFAQKNNINVPHDVPKTERLFRVLSTEQAKAMLREKGYYDYYMNKHGRGILNTYELRRISKY